MVRRRHSLDPAAPTVPNEPLPDGPEIEPKPKPRRAPSADMFEMHDGLRPPLLRFDGETRIGGPKYEAQAIACLKALKIESQGSALDTLAQIVATHGADVSATGQARAKRGLSELQAFLGLNTVLISMRQGSQK